MRIGLLDIAALLGELLSSLLRERLLVVLAKSVSSRRLLSFSLSSCRAALEDGKGRAGWLELFGSPSSMMEARLYGDRDQTMEWNRSAGSHHSRGTVSWSDLAD